MLKSAQRGSLLVLGCALRSALCCGLSCPLKTLRPAARCCCTSAARPCPAGARYLPPALVQEPLALLFPWVDSSKGL